MSVHEAHPRRLANSLGCDRLRQQVRRWVDRVPRDVSAADREILTRVRPYTMTSVARLMALMEATRSIVRDQLAGDIAECGVWRGGSMMAVALHTSGRRRTPPETCISTITFQGMPKPAARDKDARGRPAAQLLESHPPRTGLWCFADLDEVRRNMASTGYPAERIHFIAGKVEEMIPDLAPPTLSILRLDTDWYESTRHELIHLYPRLVERGVLIIDDYGHWQGAQQATDDYFAAQPRSPLLQRIDYTGRLVVEA